MSLKSIVVPAVLAIALVAASGCRVNLVDGPSRSSLAASANASWVDQLQLRIEPTGGARVASTGSTAGTWHRVQLRIGRVDGTMPILSLNFDPFEKREDHDRLETLAPGRGYWVQADLVHVEKSGAEWVVGSGTIGGNGQDVQFLPGSNVVPIAIMPVVEGAALDPSPTSLRRKSQRPPKDDGVIYVSSTIHAANTTTTSITSTTISASSVGSSRPSVGSSRSWVDDDDSASDWLDGDAYDDDSSDSSDDSDDDWSDWGSDDDDWEGPDTFLALKSQTPALKTRTSTARSAIMGGRIKQGGPHARSRHGGHR